MKIAIPLALLALPLAACEKAEAPADPPSEAADSNVPGVGTETAPAPVPTPEKGPATQPPVTLAPPSFPGAYQGRWAIKAEDCKAQPALTRIAVTADRIDFYEASARLQMVSDTPGGITANVRHEGEGETSVLDYGLALDGKVLRFTRGGETFRYTRCG